MITIKTAQTIDGKIATSVGDSKWITSEETRMFARKKRNQFDGIMVGINTIIADDPKLTPAIFKKGFKRIVLDSTLKIPLTAKVLKSAAVEDCIVVTTQNCPKSRIIQLENLGVTVVVARADAEKRIDLKWLINELKKRNIKNILIEGGATVIGSALKAKIVDQAHIYIAPKIIGDRSAKDSVIGLNIIKVSKSIKLEIKKVQKINQELFIQANVYRNN